MSAANPAYLITLFEKDAYVGGMMITDHHGIPLDFKYTDQVTPTKVQRIIYGSVMEQYIRNHVIIGALVQELKQQPNFFVVSQHQIFEIQEANSLPVIALQRTQFNALGEPGAVNRAKENEILLQGRPETPPTRVIFGEMQVEQQETIIKDLIYLAKFMDLVEPMERLEEALKVLCLDKNGDL